MSSLKKYKKIKYLGKGSYGAALLVELKSNPSQKFVIKEIVIGHLKENEQNAAKKEAEVLHQMSHSNITMYIESFVEASKLYIVMEHADGGDLSGAIQKRKAESRPWVEDELMRIFVQICLALKHVHSANILHRDLKSQNIFLTQKGMVKLGDFGIAKVLDASDDQARTQIGTPYYLSPEICDNRPYGRKSDVWSLGVVLYEIMALEMPFQANSLPALVHKICSAEPSYSTVSQRYSATLLTLTKNLLLKNPEKRPSMGTIIKTDFIKIHISRLLSYTLKAGNGGVDSSNSEADRRPSINVNIDPEMAERDIEMARAKQREVELANISKLQQESKDTSVRQAHREEERRKLREFRQEMANRKKENGRNGSEDDTDIAVSPRNRQVDTSQVKAAPVVVPDARKYQAAGKSDYSDESSVVSSAIRGSVSPPIGPGKSLAELQAEKNRHAYERKSGYDNSSALVSQRGGGSEYESAARREYFASRAAAQAVKAKVESYERGGAASHNSGHARRYSDGSDSSSAPPTDLSRLDPETRIAVIKAQKEKDRERELAAKERQLQEAYETNRQERKRFEGMKEQAQHQKGAIAFEIDVGSEATRIDPEVRLSMMKAQKEKEKEQELANKEKQLKEAYQESRQERRKLKEQAQQNQGAMAFDIDLNGDVKVLDSKSRNSDGGKPKKGWGPPVPTSNLQLAHGVRSAALGCAQPPGRNDVRQEEVKSVSIDEDDMKSGYSEFDGLGETEVMKKLQSKRASQLEARAQVKDVFRKLREKKKKEAEKKAAGKPPLRGSERSPSHGGDSKRVVSPMRARLNDIMNSVEMANESVQKAIESGSSKSRGREKRNSKSPTRIPVRAQAKSSSKSPPRERGRSPVARTENASAVRNQRTPQNSRSRSPGPGRSASNVQNDSDKTPPAVHSSNQSNRANLPRHNNGHNRSFKDVKDPDEITEEIETGEDDDLDHTLESWLTKQKKNVTVRRKKSQRNVLDTDCKSASADEVLEDDGIDSYGTDTPFSNIDRRDRGDGHDSLRYSDASEVEDDPDDYEPDKGNDAEVAGLQYMLAQALIGDENEDDNDDDEDNC